ncbi:MAG: two-component regulator propeller domain-containing protein [Candidatus Latescibacterota bacterium]
MEQPRRDPPHPPGRTRRAGPGLRHGSWQTFGPQDGLAGSMVWDVRQDPHGSLWFACSGGVSRYDGATFTTLPHPSGWPCRHTPRCETGRGNLWVASARGGLARCRDGPMTVYTTADGLPDDHVLCLLLDHRDVLWCGTERGLCAFDGASFRTFGVADGLPGECVSTLLEDGQGRLWVGVGTWREKGAGLARLEGDRFAAFTAADGLPPGGVRALLEDQDGRLWCGAYCGLAVLDGRQFRVAGPDAATRIRVGKAMAVDREGSLWVGSWGDGLWRLRDGRWTHYTTADGLASSHVLSIHEDACGHLWLGTLGGGVCRYEGNVISACAAAEGVPEAGACRLLADGDGTLWAGCQHGLVRWHPAAPERFERVCPDLTEGVWGLVWDDEGRLWLATTKGVQRLVGDQSVEPAEMPQDPDWCWCAGRDAEGALWFGTWHHGALRWDGQALAAVGPTEGLTDPQVGGLLLDRRGRLWLGTGHGVACLEDGRLTARTLDADLAAHEVGASCEDCDGHLWFGTSGGGVSRWDGLVLQSLSARDGLVSNGVHDVPEDGTGAVWVATEGGITRCRPSPVPPTVRVTDVVTDQPQGPVAQAEASAQRGAAVEFQGASLTTPPERLAYVWRVGGADAPWQVARGERVELASLPVGEHTFEVCAGGQGWVGNPESTPRIPSARRRGCAGIRRRGPGACTAQAGHASGRRASAAR